MGAFNPGTPMPISKDLKIDVLTACITDFESAKNVCTAIRAQSSEPVIISLDQDIMARILHEWPVNNIQSTFHHVSQQIHTLYGCILIAKTP